MNFEKVSTCRHVYQILLTVKNILYIIKNISYVVLINDYLPPSPNPPPKPSISYWAPTKLQTAIQPEFDTDYAKRRKASTVGEDKVTKNGFKILIPGLALVALAGSMQSLTVLLIGLFLMAVGSAMAIPCLTSLVSFYTPAEDQGRVIGVYRSVGALGRTVGPIAGGILYWKFEYAAPYIFAAVTIFLSLFIMAKLPEYKKKAE